MLKTTNAGAKWTPVSVPNLLRINDIYFADAKTGWACQGAGRILKTTNGGASWTEIATGTPRAFLAMHFVDAKTGWAVGGGSVYRVIYKTTDGGNTWTAQNVPNGEALMDVFFINATTGWTVGMNGAIFKTTDGGANWVAQNSGRAYDWLECVYFKDADIGFVGGSEGLLQTTDGGATWTFTDLAGWVDDLVFIDPQNGFAVGAISSQLSKGIDGAGTIDVGGGGDRTWQTTDGGKTWKETLQSGTKWLLRAFFTDRNSGWGIGSLGAIMKYTDALPLPAPPSNLTADAIPRNAIKLTWADNASNENGFHLYRSAGVSGAFRLLTTLGANTVSYTDTALTFGTAYWYRLEAFNAIGNSALSLDAFATAGYVVTVEQDREIPTQFALEQNYPNPFWSATTSSARGGGNSTTFIVYSLPQPAQVELKVYDVLGHEIRVLVNEKKPAGVHGVPFDGQGLPGGLYFYRLRAGAFVETKKMLVVR
ncbi:MAG: Ycf48-like protein [bacterium]|nr:Ycf48-like protein [bacterium]